MKIVHPSPQPIDYDFSEKLREAKQMVNLFRAAIAAQQVVADNERLKQENAELEKDNESLRGERAALRAEVVQITKDRESVRETQAEESRRIAAAKQDYQELVRRIDSVATKME
jgi:cell division septum initiation protein DivIVA